MLSISQGGKPFHGALYLIIKYNSRATQSSFKLKRIMQYSLAH